MRACVRFVARWTTCSRRVVVSLSGASTFCAEPCFVQARLRGPCGNAEFAHGLRAAARASEVDACSGRATCSTTHVLTRVFVAEETAEKPWVGGRVITFVVGGISFLEVWALPRCHVGTARSDVVLQISSLDRLADARNREVCVCVCVWVCVCVCVCTCGGDAGGCFVELVDWRFSVAANSLVCECVRGLPVARSLAQLCHVTPRLSHRLLLDPHLS